MSLSVFLIGDTSRPEFREACAALEEVAHVIRLADVDAAAAALVKDPLTPHGIVLVQSHPGQLAADPRIRGCPEVERLRGLAPLCRLIVLLGSWCEGEPRSGHPLPGVVRVYWHEAAVRFRREFPRWCTPDSAWSLPTTATDEERLLALLATSLPTGTGLVAVWTRRREMAGLLADTCRMAGYATAWLHPRLPGRVQGAAAAIFDADALDTATLDELKQFAAHIAPAPVLVLLGAPRIQDVRLARALGAVVMAKPFRVDELLWALATAMPSGQHKA